MIQCDCNASDVCPLGKTGMDRRCSLEELKQVIVRLKADLSSTNRVSQHNAMELQKARRELQAIKYAHEPPILLTENERVQFAEMEAALKEAVAIGVKQKARIAELEAAR